MINKLVLCLVALAVLGVGCGKYKECGEAGTQDQCDAKFFEDGKFLCKWDPAANDAKGKCVSTSGLYY
jgi:hypothetical protein